MRGKKNKFEKVQYVDRDMGHGEFLIRHKKLEFGWVVLLSHKLSRE